MKQGLLRMTAPLVAVSILLLVLGTGTAWYVYRLQRSAAGRVFCGVFSGPALLEDRGGAATIAAWARAGAAVLVRRAGATHRIPIHGGQVMVQTIEAFVNRLQADGVEAGRDAAEKIRAAAEQNAQGVLEEARQQAGQILEEARAESERLRARTDAELKLAARDTLVRLQEAVQRALRGVLFRAVRETLTDGRFLTELIRETVRCYAQADAAGRTPITINVSEEARRRLMDLGLAAFGPDGAGSAGASLQGTLAEAGFEYRVADGTVEVTADALVEVLAEIVGPELRKLFAEGPG